MKDCDANPDVMDEKHSSGSGENQAPPAHQTQYSLQHSFNTPQPHTYSSSNNSNNSGGSNNAANTSSSGNNSLFNKLYFSGK